jgi:small subunit ribosomal protein S20
MDSASLSESVDAAMARLYKSAKLAAGDPAADVLWPPPVMISVPGVAFGNIRTDSSVINAIQRPAPSQAIRDQVARKFESMANTTSAKKATRKIARRTIVNKSRRTQMRGSVRIVEEAIERGDREAALKAMAVAEPELMQAAQRSIIHKNNASRKVSRLSHQIAKLAK